MAALGIIVAGDPVTTIQTICRTFRLPAIILAIGIILLGTNPAWSRPVTDEYILGFATSVLHHEFNVIDATLKVRSGVVWVNSSGLEGINQDKLKRAFRQHRGCQTGRHQRNGRDHGSCVTRRSQ